MWGALGDKFWLQGSWKWWKKGEIIQIRKEKGNKIKQEKLAQSMKVEKQYK